MLFGGASDTWGQPPTRSAWGFSGSIVPKWKTPAELNVLFPDYDTADLSGSELRVGVVRGRALSGDWGISYVRKRFADDSRLATVPGTACFGGSCFEQRTIAALQNVHVNGLEIHKFIPFVTIKRRAQIGMVFAGGVGRFRGSAFVDAQSVGFVDGRPVLRRTTDTVAIEQLFILENGIVPLARLELAAAAILSNSLKLRVSGGINMPGTQTVSVQGIYLFPQ